MIYYFAGGVFMYFYNELYTGLTDDSDEEFFLQ